MVIFCSLQFLNGANKFQFKPPEVQYTTSRNTVTKRDLSPFLTTFRGDSNEFKSDFLFHSSTKEKIAKKPLPEIIQKERIIPKKELPEITHCYGIPLQTTATFANQKTIAMKKKENNSFFLFNTNTTFEKEKVKKEISHIFKERSPIAKNSFYEEISFDMSLNVNLEQETSMNNGQNLSFLAQSHLNKHIENIDEDIEGLADIFHDKMIKEKTLKVFKCNLLIEKEIFQVRNSFFYIKK